MVMIQTEKYGGGEIYFDDVLIRKNGLFVLPELTGLNPENLRVTSARGKSRSFQDDVPTTNDPKTRYPTSRRPNDPKPNDTSTNNPMTKQKRAQGRPIALRSVREIRISARIHHFCKRIPNVREFPVRRFDGA